jgi:DNA-binding response OmpR family regulator
MAIDDLDEPINCLYFTDCESAVAHFSQHNATPPSFVFIDLKLPRVAGDECLRQLQQLRQFDGPFMVAYSSSVPDDLRQKLSNSGVDKVIQKTASITELTSQIRDVVKMH